MFPFKKTLQTKNITPGINSCQYIILHHTATQEGSIDGVLKTLTETANPVSSGKSCHFVIDTNGDTYKIGDPKNILWHAGESKWWDLIFMNRYSLGIEFIWPLSSEWFTREQIITGTRLVEYLMLVFWIPKENIIRHKDITHDGSHKKILWTPGTRSRKIDPYDNLFPENNFLKWRDDLIATESR